LLLARCQVVAAEGSSRAKKTGGWAPPGFRVI
jgi:hypothetical protein